MEIIFKGHADDVERFINEIILPVIYQRQNETQGRYFRITGDKSDYWRRNPNPNFKVRKIRGYFPASYYPVDFFEGKYDRITLDQMAKENMIDELEEGSEDQTGSPEDVK